MQNLNLLRESLSKHQGIMIHLATLIRGNEFNIFFPWADLDLHDFIYEEQDQFAHLKCPSALVHEASNLADALDFLHEKIRIPGGRNISCVHMDLKPENIVVRAESSPSSMRWMITDFGISTMREPTPIDPDRLAIPKNLPAVNSAGDVAANLTGFTPRRNPGPFQAPEVQEAARLIGRKSDVWSLGCILSLILALATGRSTAVRAFDQARREDPYADNYFYRRAQNIPTEHHQRWEINDKVSQYLRELAKNQDSDREWISSFVDLILKTLDVDIGQRPWAAEVHDRLRTVSYLISNTSTQVNESIVVPALESSPSTTMQELSVTDTDQSEPSQSLGSIIRSSINPLSYGNGLSLSDNGLEKFLSRLLQAKTSSTRSPIRTALSLCGYNVAIVIEGHVAVYCLRHLFNVQSIQGGCISVTEGSYQPIFLVENVQSRFLCLSDRFLLTCGDEEVSDMANVKKKTPERSTKANKSFKVRATATLSRFGECSPASCSPR